MSATQDYLEIKPHSLKKYSILGKYLAACQKFENKYHNFAYVDTHAGSGKVLLKGSLIEGSPIIAAQTQPTFPCHVVEIDPDRSLRLKKEVEAYPNIIRYYGDCNKMIGKILDAIEDWKFVFCFLDPDGLVYNCSDGSTYDQLAATTVDKIASRAKSELLLNFPLEAILRCSAYVHGLPDGVGTAKMKETVTRFMGTCRWTDEQVDKTKLVTFYTSNRLDSKYQYWGAILIRSENNVPLYYLVYASNHPVGIKIMRDIMRKEFYGSIRPLVEVQSNHFILED